MQTAIALRLERSITRNVPVQVELTFEIRDHRGLIKSMAVRTVAAEHTTPPQSGVVGRKHFALEWADALCAITLCILTVLSWFPRSKGPLDLRWDGGTYYILGTSIAQGKGYRLLNEPGEIRADQYP